MKIYYSSVCISKACLIIVSCLWWVFLSRGFTFFFYNKMPPCNFLTLYFHFEDWAIHKLVRKDSTIVVPWGILYGGLQETFSVLPEIRPPRGQRRALPNLPQSWSTSSCTPQCHVRIKPSQAGFAFLYWPQTEPPPSSSSNLVMESQQNLIRLGPL